MDLSCRGPWWQLDDFSPCFRHKYLGVFLPVTIAAVSALWLVSRLFVAWNRKRSWSKRQEYRRISNSDALLDRAARPYSDQPDDDTCSITSSDSSVSRTPYLSIHKRTDEIREVENKPRGVYTMAILELLAVLAQVGTTATLVVLRRPSDHSHISYTYLGYVVHACIWAYIAAILVLRFALSSSNGMTLRLWYNSVVCYGCLAAISTVSLRTALIHPVDDLTTRITIANFSLSTFLTIMLLCQRKGNRTVYVQYEGKLHPSKEQTASLISIATFSWITSLIWTGYKRSLTMADVWNLLPRDKARYMLDEYRQVKKTTIMAYHLVGVFRTQLLVQGAWAALEGFLIFVPTLLLQSVIHYVEQPDSTPTSVAWLYISLFFVSGFFSALADGQALWIGRKLSIHLRAIIIGEIYAKTLRRRATVEATTALGAEKPAFVPHVNAAVSPFAGDDNSKLRILLRWILPCFFRRRGIMLSDTEAGLNPPQPAPTDDDDSPSKGESSKGAASSGAIINLMSVDAFHASTISAYLHLLWASTPIQVITAVWLLYRVLGFSALAGIALMAFILPVNLLIARKFSSLQKLILAATDSRIQKSNEVFQNIRIIKYFAWEDRFIGELEEKRTAEISALRRKYWWWSVAASVWSGSPILITLFSFFCYTVIEGKQLLPSIAFTAVSLFQILRVPLDQLADMVAHVQESKVSIDRVEEFLNQAETDKHSQLKEEIDADGNPLIGFKNANFSWSADDSASNTTDDPSSDAGESSAWKLFDVDFQFHLDGFNVVVGPTGSGKSSLLMALLGEMTKLGGEIYLPGAGRPREECRPNPVTGLTDTVAYCAQQAWLINNTIRENILFSRPYDRERYDAVVDACCLTRDFEILDNGDQTLVGEKGVTVSGGQKQRISLARALYSSSRIVLLDDILSAVDSHTAKKLFEEALLGPLMHNRTCILVTHNASLCLPSADFGIVMDNGRVVAKGNVKELNESGKLTELVVESTSASRIASGMPSRVPSQLGGEEAGGELSRQVTHDVKSSGSPHSEDVATGSVKMSVILFYLKSMGGMSFWVIGAAAFLLQQAVSVAINVWVRHFANAYARRNGDIEVFTASEASPSPSSYPVFTNGAGPMSYLSSNVFGWTSQPSDEVATFDSGPGPEVNPIYYLSVYAGIGLFYTVLTGFREYFFFGGSLTASRNIHRRLVEGIARARLRFFDSTPLGQIMNRFSKDVATVDQEVAANAIGVVYCIFGVLTIVGLVSVVVPMFLFAAVVIVAMYCGIGTLYINSCRDLKRLESVQRSPLFQHFGETLSGVVTIRAYGDNNRFIRDNLVKVDTFNRPYIYLQAANRWLSIWVDVIGAFVSFCAGAFVISSVGRIDPGAAGLAMSYALSFNENILWFVRLYSQNEQNMNSVERIQEYLKVEQEAAPIVEKNRPAADWPSQGAVEFVNYSTRYRSDLDLVLRNLSFKIEPGTRVGVVGRTGAGKSSLALAMFRALEAEEGQIIVDSVDIGTIGLRDLRERIVMVPQDPTLFTGTIRSNLDPFKQIEDDNVIFQALVDVKLIDAIPGSSASSSDGNEATDEAVTAAATPAVPSSSTSSDGQAENVNVFLNLDSKVAESGTNLSQGQRQLLCLARAILRKPKILLMDEATASIDYATDSKIQDTIRRMDHTTITIAHRLVTIIDYHQIIVLDQGSVVECAHPWELLQKEDGVFKGMCESSGEIELLRTEAKAAWEKRAGGGGE